MELMKRDFLTVTDDDKKTSAFTRAKGISLGKYVMTLFGEAEGKGLYCVIRDEGDFIDW